MLDNADACPGCPSTRGRQINALTPEISHPAEEERVWKNKKIKKYFESPGHPGQIAIAMDFCPRDYF
jgi:hypothetical protein